MKPNLIDNSQEECKQQEDKNCLYIERCTIIVMLAILLSVGLFCYIGCNNRTIKGLEGKIRYQDSVIKSNQWKGAEDVDAR